MSTFYERLSKLALQSSKSINKIERDLGYPRNALHNYKYCENPSGLRIAQLSAYFGVTPEFLVGFSDVKTSHSVEQIFDSLSQKEKLEMFNYCQQWFISKLEAKI